MAFTKSRGPSGPEIYERGQKWTNARRKAEAVETGFLVALSGPNYED